MVGMQHDTWWSRVGTTYTSVPPQKLTGVSDSLFGSYPSAFDLAYLKWATVQPVTAPGEYRIEDIAFTPMGGPKGLVVTINDYPYGAAPNWYRVYVQLINGAVSLRVSTRGEINNGFVNGLDLDPTTAFRRILGLNQTACVSSQRTAEIRPVLLERGAAVIAVNPNAPGCVSN